MVLDISDYVREAKQQLTPLSNVSATFSDIKGALAQETDIIRTEQAAGRSVIPEVDFSAIRDDTVPDTTRDAIRHRGCAIIRGVYPRTMAEDWNAQLGAYIEENDYVGLAKEKAGIDKYFTGLDAGSPQIFGLYWSKPQIEARQGEAMAVTKRFLNRLYDVSGPMGDEFDPDNDYAYADRTRRRKPGDTKLGLSPHMDTGSYERWLDPAYQKIYGKIFGGHWRDFDPWKATYRTQTREYSSPAVCSMFRSFQGWTALTTQGPTDGTLQLVPWAQSIAYILTRALQSDVAPDDLCGATPGRALGADPEWHADLLEALVPIPTVEPGDTVWWHPDVVHAVGDEHNGADYANVIYVGASPRCAKNQAYVGKQAEAFLAGRSAPDFAPEDYEVAFKGRATIDDLTDLGRAQMGL